MGVTTLSGNELLKARTGRGVGGHLSYATSRYSLGGSKLSPKAQEVQKQLKEHGLIKAGRTPIVLSSDEALGEDGRRRKAMDEESSNPVKKIWMGEEKEGWKEKRLREEQEALDDGRGYGGLIMDQIKEVWYGSEKKMEEVKAEDEKRIVK
jgi:hypothetical protein